MTEYPISTTPVTELDRIGRLERRAEVRRHQLKRSLHDLERAMKARLPTEAVKQQIDDNPYGTIVFATVAGLMLGLTF